MLHPHIYIYLFIYSIQQVGPLLVVEGDSSSRPQVHCSNKTVEGHSLVARSRRRSSSNSNIHARVYIVCS